MEEKVARRNEFDDSGAVTTWMEELTHPLKAVIEQIRPVILASDPSITEGIKWNTASFYCHGWFATINTRAKSGIQIVLHHGAKIREASALSQTIEDTSQLLTWLSVDRATITFVSVDDFERKQIAFKRIIRQWAEYQQSL